MSNMTPLPPSTESNIGIKTFSKEGTVLTPSKTAAPEAPKVSAPEVKKEAVPAGTDITPDKGTKPIEIKPDPTTGERMFKVKVDGQWEEKTEAELIKGYSAGAAAQKKMQEAAKMNADAKAFIEQLRNNPAKILNDPRLGLDVKKFAEEYLLQMYQDEMDPVAAENRRMKNQLEEVEAQRKAAREAEIQAEESKAAQYWQAEFIKDIESALSTSKTLPINDPAVLNRVIHYMRLGRDAGYIARNGRAATAADILPLVEADFKTWTTSMYANATPEQLMEVLGEDGAKKIRKHDIARLKNPIPTTGKSTSSPKPKKSQGVNTIKNFRDQMRERDAAKGIK